jgi:hypothetical protein
MVRPIRMDHTNCLQVAIKTLQFRFHALFVEIPRFTIFHITVISGCGYLTCMSLSVIETYDSNLVSTRLHLPHDLRKSVTVLRIWFAQLHLSRNPRKPQLSSTATGSPKVSQSGKKSSFLVTLLCATLVKTFLVFTRLSITLYFLPLAKKKIQFFFTTRAVVR